MDFENKNEKQIYFNQVRGVVSELNDGEEWCSVSLSCGHERLRNVNLVCKKPQFQKIKDKHGIGDKVVCQFYVSSHKKHERWFTSCILLSVDLD